MSEATSETTTMCQPRQMRATMAMTARTSPAMPSMGAPIRWAFRGGVSVCRPWRRRLADDVSSLTRYMLEAAR